MLADIITQAELKSVLETYNALGQIILGIRRRIEAGAAVEEGIYTAQSNTGDPISGFDRAMNGIGMFGLDLETKGLPSDVYAEPVTATEPAQEEDREPASKFPEWVGFEPLADYRLIAWESDERSVEIGLTQHEYQTLKAELAEMRGYVATEVAHV